LVSSNTAVTRRIREHDRVHHLIDERKRTPRGGSWHPQLLERIIERLDLNQNTRVKAAPLSNSGIALELTKREVKNFAYHVASSNGVMLSSVSPVLALAYLALLVLGFAVGGLLLVSDKLTT
jgi:hypothetical protein